MTKPNQLQTRYASMLLPALSFICQFTQTQYLIRTAL